MTLEIQFELDEHDLERFKELFSNARTTHRTGSDHELLDAAKQLIDKGLSGSPPAFVRQELEGLRHMIAMTEDEAWSLPIEERKRILDVLAYFVASDDVIPDSTPVLGLLDDAIAAEIVLRALQHELDAYDEFCQFRSAETQRRANQGKTTDVSKEDWLADRRATLHHRMRERRMADPQGWHTITLWGDD